MKKLIAFVFAAFAVLGLVSCGKQDNPTDDFGQNNDEFVANIEVFIVGSHWNSWTPDYDKISVANPSCKFVKDEKSVGLETKYVYTATVTQEMIDAWCGFKFVSISGWGTQWGMEDIDFEKSNEAFLKQIVGDADKNGTIDKNDKYAYHEGTSNRNNVVATKPGTYVIEYYPYNFASETVNDVPYSCKFAVQFTPAA